MESGIIESGNITVKGESMERFFTENCGGKYMDSLGSGCGFNIFHLMTDEIVIRISEKFHKGDNVEFIIESKSMDGKFDVEHYYRYMVSYYDDLSYKLHLVDFEVRRKI